MIGNILDVFLHLDKYIGLIIERYGLLVYLIIFLVILAETGLVIAPFLPGDSLLFVVGAFAATGSFNVVLMFFILAIAAILGDSLNYWIGSYFGKQFFEKNRLFNRKYYDKAEEFYKKHGGKTIIMARFMPVIRTFAPFVAGVGRMDYLRFLGFNVVGGIIWVGLFIFSGYYFGGIPLVKDNLTWVILGIVALSLLPIIYKAIVNKN